MIKGGGGGAGGKDRVFMREEKTEAEGREDEGEEVLTCVLILLGNYPKYMLQD